MSDHYLCATGNLCRVGFGYFMEMFSIFVQQKTLSSEEVNSFLN